MFRNDRGVSVSSTCLQHFISYLYEAESEGMHTFTWSDAIKITLTKAACVSKVRYRTPFHDTKLSLISNFQGRTCCVFIVDCRKSSYDGVISSRVTVRRLFSKMGPRLKVERGKQTGAQVTLESAEIPKA